jgi:hypothetical protein
LPFAHGELAEKVFVNLAKDVALTAHRNIEGLEQRDERLGVQAGAGLEQDAFEVFVLPLDGGHGGVDGPANVRAFGEGAGVEPSGGFWLETSTPIGILICAQYIIERGIWETFR